MVMGRDRSKKRDEFALMCSRANKTFFDGHDDDDELRRPPPLYHLT